MAITGFSAVPKLLKTQSLTIADVNTVTSPEQTFTVNGLTTDMFVMVQPESAIPTNLGISHCYVSAANTLKIRFINPTAGTITGAAVTFKIMAL